MPEETKPLTLAQSFEAAKAEVSKEQPAATEKATVPEAKGDTETAKAQEPEQTESSADQATETDVEPELLTQEEAAILDKDPNLKRGRKILTEKYQRVAAERRKLEPYQNLISSYENDPEGTIRKLAIEHGLIKEEQKPEEKVPGLIEQLKSSLGPELEFLADKLAPAIEQTARRIAEEQVGPIKQTQEAILTKAATEKTEAVMKNFAEKHKDWKQHEPKMLEWAETLQPKGMDEGKYLEALYKLATSEQQSATAVQKTIERINQSAKAAEPADAGVSGSRVNPSPGRSLSIREAAQMALKGETVAP